MVNVNTEKCIGCGKCVKDCIVGDIEFIDKKAKVKNKSCFKCGHCIAICPTNAVSTDEYNMEEVKNYNENDFKINSENLLNFIKFRRTIRKFTDKDVEIEKIQKIIEAGRFTQTGSNSQNVSYIVVKDNINELKEITIEALKDMGEHILQNSNSKNSMFEKYAKMWVQMYNGYKKDPKNHDMLFFNAPVVILVVSDSEVNASLASSNMELMTNALGLGTLFSGFLVRASQGNKKIIEFAGLDESKKIVTCMVIGYPDVKYLRTAPRKDAQIAWK